MIIEKDETLKVEQTSNFKRRKYSIASTREAFMILSKGIYSDPITAVIRELSTNAVDGHVIRGNTDKPFDVYLPTALDPVFRIRDYGCSLTPDQIENIYTTYFESNKRDTNDLNGSLGLGSKSPFAVVSSFLVTTYLDGKKTIYNAFVSEDGCPDFAEMAQTDTDEDQGVEVKFTVSSNDIYNFESRAYQVYKFFDLPPNVWKGSEQLTIKKPEYASTYASFGVINDYYEHSRAIQANVAYTLDLAPLEGKISDEKLGILRNSNTKYHFFFDNGSVNFTASRESLEYTPKTIAAIDKKLDEMLQLVQKEFDTLRSKAETLPEACFIINNMLAGHAQGSTSSVNYYALKVLANLKMQQDNYIKWKKVRVTKEMCQKGININYEHKLTNDEVVNVLGQYTVKPGTTVGVTVLDGSGDKNKSLLQYTSTLIPLRSIHNRFIQETKYTIPTNTVTLIYNDAKLAQYKISDYVKNNSLGRTILVFHVSQLDLLETIQKECYIPTYIKTSEIEVTEVERVALVQTIRSINPYNGRVTDIEAKNVDKLRYYIVARKSPFTFDVFNNENILSFTDTQQLLNDLHGMKIIPSDSIAILPASNVDKILSLYPNLKPFGDVFSNYSDLPESLRTKLMIHNSKGIFAGFTNIIEATTRNINTINMFVDNALDNNQAKKYLQLLTTMYGSIKNIFEFAKNNRYTLSINDELADELNRRFKNDIKFNTHSKDISTFIKQYEETCSIMPAITVQYGDKIPKDAINRYINADWDNHIQNKEINNEHMG